MNSWIYFGKIVNTHGIKGELRIKSDFDKKELVLKPSFYLYIGHAKTEEKIVSYRPHKGFDMVCFEHYQNINEVLKYIQEDVYIHRSDLNLESSDYLIEDLIDCKVIDNNIIIGKVIEIMYNKSGILLKVQKEDEKTFYIPHNPNFIIQVNIEKKEIKTNHGQDLIL